MGQPLTFYAAVKMLDNPGPLLGMLDDLDAGVGLDNADTMPPRLSDLRRAIVDDAARFARQLPEWRSDISRFKRTQRLAALHTVVVVSSVFADLTEAGVPTQLLEEDPRGLTQKLSRTPRDFRNRYSSLNNWLHYLSVPLPEPHQARSAARRAIGSYQESLLTSLGNLMFEWSDARGDGEKQRMAALGARMSVQGSAILRYEQTYDELAKTDREFALWAGLTEEAPPPSSSLAGLSRLLGEMSIRRPGQHDRSALATAYRGALDAPILGPGPAPAGVELPTIREGYVDPVGKIDEITQNDQPADAAWWQEPGRPLVPDIGAYLAGFLTSPRATETPLVVLGEPGSGKSKLTEVLAARLPEEDFRAVLVPLRDLAAESLIKAQINQALAQHVASTDWATLLATAGGALPVVVLDGFDELLQATSLHRYDYLEQICAFQREQAQAGHPVAVLVTSRTVVADQVKFPAGTIVLQLQPFSDAQVDHWLTVWNRHNASPLRQRGRQPLSADVVRRHRALTAQPLLLLLMAIFDATDDYLRSNAALGQAELYKRLLTDFARREIEKDEKNRKLPDDEQDELVEREIRRLAVVALAMFARGRQAASGTELNEDLGLLLPKEEPAAAKPGARLTPAQRAAGHFFFIHDSKARSQGDKVHSYEFLHATFAEFLVAHLVVEALGELALYQELGKKSTTVADGLPDGFLYAVLSFSCLFSRTPIIDFAAELLQQLPRERQAQYRRIIISLIKKARFPEPTRGLQGYEPVRSPVTRRIACYSANLVTLLVLLGEPVSAADFCAGADLGRAWGEHSHLWRSALSTAEWISLVDTIRVCPRRQGSQFDVMLTRETRKPLSPLDCIAVTTEQAQLTDFEVTISQQTSVSLGTVLPASSVAGRIFREMAFLPRWHTAALLLHSVPYLQATDGNIGYLLPDGTLSLPGTLLAALDYAQTAQAHKRYELYGQCADAVATSAGLQEQLLDRMVRDVQQFTAGETLKILGRLDSLPPSQSACQVILALRQRRTADADSTDDAASKALGELTSRLRGSWPADALASIGEPEAGR